MYFSFDLKFPQFEFLHRVGSALSSYTGKSSLLVKSCALVVGDVWLMVGGGGVFIQRRASLSFSTFVSVSASCIRNSKSSRTFFL